MENFFTYTVVPMDTASDEIELQGKLISHPGVALADVSKTQGRIYVRGESINEQVICQLIQQSGYNVISSNIS